LPPDANRKISWQQDVHNPFKNQQQASSSSSKKNPVDFGGLRPQDDFQANFDLGFLDTEDLFSGEVPKTRRKSNTFQFARSRKNTEDGSQCPVIEEEPDN